MAEKGDDRLTVVIGTTVAAHEAQRRVAMAGCRSIRYSGDPRGLRRILATGDGAPVVLCLVLDDLTIARHGAGLKRLLADLACLPGSPRSIGVLVGCDLDPCIAQLGCDVYARGSARVEHVDDVFRLLRDLEGGTGRSPMPRLTARCRRSPDHCPGRRSVHRWISSRRRAPRWLEGWLEDGGEAPE